MELKKIRYLDANNVKIRNSLIVLDPSLLSITKDSPGVIFMKHPELSGRSKLSFQFEFVKAFFDRKFYFGYFTYKFFKIYNGTKQYHIWGYTAKNNELNDVFTEQLIKKDSINYSNYMTKI